VDVIYKHKKTVILACILMVAWGSSFYISTKLLMSETQEIVVPKVIGFPIAEAERMLKQRKLILKIDKQIETLEFPENTVISQSIEPGAIVKENRTMYLRISKHKDSIEIPNFIGKDLFDVKKIVEKENLKLTNIAYACSKNFKSGKIFSQNPLHEELGVDRNIQILVSNGSCQNQFMIGSLVGEQVDSKIKKEFLDKDIDLKQVSSKSNRENIKASKVISQDPSMGSIIKSGDSVVLNME
jgi:beta-lactam-binding protein with PASTA domain